MTGPNLNPSPADVARLIARVEKLERALRSQGARRLDQLEDTAVPQPATDDALIFDGAKWVPGTAGVPATGDALYAYTGWNITPGGSDLMVWGLADGDTLLDLSSTTNPTPVDPGLFIFTAMVGTADTLSSWDLHLTIRPSGGVTQRPAWIDGIATPARATATVAAVLQAGDDVELELTNDDGSNFMNTTTAVVSVARIG